MPQISKGDTFADGQQVTGARLNQLIDSATILPALITDQTAITAGTLASTDSTIVYNTSTLALRKVTVSDLVNTGASITTGTINSANDTAIVPTQSSNKTGASYVGGTTSVTVTYTAHGLAVGQCVNVYSATNTAYQGIYRVLTVPDANTFTYNIDTPTTAGNGTCSWRRSPTLKVSGNEQLTNNLFVNNNLYVDGYSNFTGSVTTGTNPVTIGGTISNGTNPLTIGGSVNVSGNLTVGTFNVKQTKVALAKYVAENYQYNAYRTWTDLPLNTLTDPDSFVVNSSSFTGSGTSNSIITLPAGTYVIQSFATLDRYTGGGGDNYIKIKIYNDTTSSDIELGSSGHAYLNQYNPTSSTVYTVVKLTAQTNIKLKYKVYQTGNYYTALPAPNDFETVNSMFATLITKII